MYDAHAMAGFLARATGMIDIPSRSNSCAASSVLCVMSLRPRRLAALDIV